MDLLQLLLFLLVFFPHALTDQTILQVLELLDFLNGFLADYDSALDLLALELVLDQARNLVGI